MVFRARRGTVRHGLQGGRAHTHAHARACAWRGATGPHPHGHAVNVGESHDRTTTTTTTTTTAATTTTTTTTTPPTTLPLPTWRKQDSPLRRGWPGMPRCRGGTGSCWRIGTGWHQRDCARTQTCCRSGLRGGRAVQQSMGGGQVGFVCFPTRTYTPNTGARA